MSDLYVMKSKCVLNGVGLYSKEQVEELEKRGDDLWKALNWVHSGLWVYVDALEKEMAKMDRWKKITSWLRTLLKN